MRYFHTALLLLLLHIPVLTMDFFCFGRPGTCFVDWTCLELRDLPVAFRVLELKWHCYHLATMDYSEVNPRYKFQLLVF